MCSDHVSPWSERQGHSGFAWAWLGAAMQATTLPFGVVNAPGQRYHPVIVAQAIATLATMFEGRLWVALGSGEASNEHITGAPWPRKDLRNARLGECVTIIRALLRGEEVPHDWTGDGGPGQSVDPAEHPTPADRTRSQRRYRRVGCRLGGRLVTIAQPHDKLRKMIDAYRTAGG